MGGGTAAAVVVGIDEGAAGEDEFKGDDSFEDEDVGSFLPVDADPLLRSLLRLCVLRLNRCCCCCRGCSAAASGAGAT